jgi:alkylation response protein AidB-like acyl-CoA dehydrogenase
VATIIGMVMMTRLDCMLGAAAEMRMALAQALHHARHRRTFGKLLVEHPLMTNVLADLALESEAATVLSMRIARAVDRAGVDANEAALARWGRRWASTGCASARRPSSMKRRNAWAVRAMWRNRCCRGCTGRHR